MSIIVLMDILAITTGIPPIVWVAVIGFVQATVLAVWGRTKKKNVSEIKKAVDTGNGQTLGKYTTLINDKIDLLTTITENISKNVDNNQKVVMDRIEAHELRDDQKFERLEEIITEKLGD